MSNDLIARLEAATGPDRELDAAIALTVGLDIGRGRAHSQDSRVSAYTASIDAALTLVPKGWGVVVRRWADGTGRGVAHCYPPGGLWRLLPWSHPRPRNLHRRFESQR